MLNIEGNKLMISKLVIPIAITLTFSSLTLWLVDSWIKYPLFLLEIFVIIVLYLIANDYEQKYICPMFTVGPAY